MRIQETNQILKKSLIEAEPIVPNIAGRWTSDAARELTSLVQRRELQIGLIGAAVAIAAALILGVRKSRRAPSLFPA